MNSGLEYIVVNTNLCDSKLISLQKHLCVVTVHARHFPLALFLWQMVLAVSQNTHARIAQCLYVLCKQT